LDDRHAVDFRALPFILILFVAPAARAQEPVRRLAPSLSWVELPGAESCGGAVRIAALFEARLGRNALVPASQADISIEGRVERSEDATRWRATILLRDRDGALLGSRDIVSAAPTCDELRESSALAMALMIDPDALHRPAPPVNPAPEPPAPPLPNAAPPTVLPPAREPSIVPNPEYDQRPAKKASRVELDASFALAGDVLPAPATGVAVGVSVAPRRFWKLRALGAVFSPQSLSISASTAQAQFVMAYGGVLLCPLTVESGHGATFDFCAGSLVGGLTARGVGLSNAKTAAAPFVDILASIALTVPVAGPASLRLDVGLGVDPVEEHVVYETTNGSRDAYHLPWGNETAAIGLSCALP
jgi:hypothetical protein